MADTPAAAGMAERARGLWRHPTLIFSSDANYEDCVALLAAALTQVRSEALEEVAAIVTADPSLPLGLLRRIRSLKGR